MDRANIGMIQGGSCPRFTLKSLQRLMIGRELIGQELESNVAAQTQVFGLVDHTHATAAQSFQDAVMRNGLASHGRTPWRLIPKTPRIAPILERHDREVNATRGFENVENRPDRFTSSFVTSKEFPLPLFVF